MAARLTRVDFRGMNRKTFPRQAVDPRWTSDDPANEYLLVSLCNTSRWLPSRATNPANRRFTR